jgi:hypothetical protein
MSGSGQAGRLSMAFQAEIIVSLDQHFGIDRAMRLMADRAAFAERLVFESMNLRLFPVTLRTRLIEAPHGQTASWLHDVHPVRVVALHAIHLSFEHRVMLGQIEFSVRLQMAIEAGRRIFAGIMNEPSPAADGHMPAARTVTRFAAGQLAHVGSFIMQTSVRTRREGACDLRMAFEAGFVANEGGAFNRWRGNDCAVDARTGT